MRQRPKSKLGGAGSRWVTFPLTTPRALTLQRHVSCCVGLIVTATACGAAHPRVEAESTSSSLSSAAGCYEVLYSPGAEVGHFGGDLPDSLVLDTVRARVEFPHRKYGKQYWAWPAQWKPGDAVWSWERLYRVGMTWTAPDADSVRIVFADPGESILLNVRHNEDSVVGTAIRIDS